MLTYQFESIYIAYDAEFNLQHAGRGTVEISLELGVESMSYSQLFGLPNALPLVDSDLSFSTFHSPLGASSGDLTEVFGTINHSGGDTTIYGVSYTAGGLTYEFSLLIAGDDIATPSLTDSLAVKGSGGAATGAYAAGEVISLLTLDHVAVNAVGGLGVNTLNGTINNDTMQGNSANDTISGGAGADTIQGLEGDDFLFGDGTGSASDLRDVIYGGDGNDSLDGGAGNDELRGDAGSDTITGSLGVDEIFGGDGDDVLTGQEWSDLIFGGTGDDFINGGFGFDRVNGGDGADRFFHIGNAGHGSDWIQDFSASQGDVLQFGATAAASDFQVNFANTANAGLDTVAEAFVIQKSTGQILWALVDGAAQAELNILISGQTYDLLA
jgi:Ca2+-binding RTX toxin-like protein